MGGGAQEIEESLANGTGLGTIAIVVGQDPGEGGDGVAACTGWVGILASKIAIELDVRQGGDTRLEIRLHESAGTILDGGGFKVALHIGLVDVTDRAGGVGEDTGHTFIALAAHAHRPADALGGAKIPSGREGGQRIGEGEGGAGTIRTVSDGDRSLAALESIPSFNLTEEDIHHLPLGELQIGAIGFVVGDRDRAAHRWELNHAPFHLGGIGSLDRFISGAEIHCALDELLHPGTGAHRLIVHFGALAREGSKGALVEGRREGGTGSVEGGLSGSGQAGGHGAEDAEAKSLLGEGHRGAGVWVCP